MSRSRTILGWALAMAVAAAGAGQAQTSAIAEQMAHAATAAGISIRTDQVVAFSSPTTTVAATTVQGFEGVPATALPSGVNAGFLYIDAPSSSVPTGYYTVRASANASDVRLGDFPGTVQLIDAKGRVAATFPSDMDAFSLSVPTSPLSTTSTVSISARRRWNENYILIDYWCPNGSHFVFVVFLRPDF